MHRELIETVPGHDQHLPFASMRRQLLVELKNVMRFRNTFISFQAKLLILTNAQFIFDEAYNDYQIIKIEYVPAKFYTVTHKRFEKVIMEIINKRKWDLDGEKCKF